MDAAQFLVSRTNESGRAEPLFELSTIGTQDKSAFIQALQRPSPAPAPPPDNNADRAQEPPATERERGSADSKPAASGDGQTTTPPAAEANHDAADGDQGKDAETGDSKDEKKTNNELSAEATAAAIQASASVPVNQEAEPIKLPATAGAAKEAEPTAPGKPSETAEVKAVLTTEAPRPIAEAVTASKSLPADQVLETAVATEEPQLVVDPRQKPAPVSATTAKPTSTEAKADEKSSPVKPVSHPTSPDSGHSEPVKGKTSEETNAQMASISGDQDKISSPGDAKNRSTDDSEPADSDQTAAPNAEVTQPAVELKDSSAKDAAPALPDVSSASAADLPSPTANPQASSAVPTAIHGSSPGARLPNWLRGGKESPPEGGAVAIDSTRFLQRVTRAFEAAQSRGGSVRLRLSPPELGAVHIELRLHEGVLSARLETENSSARTALLDSLPALKDRLAEQGMRIENFEVNVGSRGSGGMPDRPQDRPEQSRPETPRRTRESNITTPDQPTRPRAWVGNSALNVIV